MRRLTKDFKAVDLVFSEVERAFVDRMFNIPECDNIGHGDIAEHRDFGAVVLTEFMFGAANDDVGLNSDFTKFGYRLLGRFGFDLSGCANERKKSYVDEADVCPANFLGELAEGFEEKVSFDVSYSATNFGNDDIGVGIFISGLLEAVLNFISDVRDELYRRAEILSFALIFDDIFEDLARTQAVGLGKGAVGKSLVVSQVKIGFSSVVENVDLAVLVGRHCAGIDIEIRIEFLEEDF